MITLYYFSGFTSNASSFSTVFLLLFLHFLFFSLYLANAFGVTSLSLCVFLLWLCVCVGARTYVRALPHTHPSQWAARFCLFLVLFSDLKKSFMIFFFQFVCMCECMFFSWTCECMCFACVDLLFHSIFVCFCLSVS